MQDFEILHNPRCSKSRETLALLQQHGVQPSVTEYLKTPPSAERLQDIAQMLPDGMSSLIRRKEALYKELDLASQELSDAQWAQVLAENPKLIERPVVIRGQQARIGRPPETVLELVE